MKINQLSSIENISLQDKFLIFSVKNGDERIASINSLTKFLNTNTVDENYINELISTSLTPFNNKLNLNSTNLLNLETRVNNVSSNLSNVSSALNNLNTNISNLSSNITSTLSSINNTNSISALSANIGLTYTGLDFLIARGAPRKQNFSLQYNNLPNSSINKNLLRFVITPSANYNADNLTKIRVILTVDLLVESYLKTIPATILYTSNYKGMAIYDYLVKDTYPVNSATVSHYCAPFNPSILAPTNLFTNISAIPTFGSGGSATSNLTALIFSQDPNSFATQNGVCYVYMWITLPYIGNSLYSGTARLNVSMIHNHTIDAQIADSSGNFSSIGQIGL